MMKTMLLFLALPLLLLTGCMVNKEPGPPPQTIMLEVPDTLTTCAPIPAHPCPLVTDPVQAEVSVASNTAAPPAPRGWGLFLAKLRGREAETPKPEPEPPAAASVCLEKDRLRWEALLMDGQRDCKSKLVAVRKLLKGQTNAAHAPP